MKKFILLLFVYCTAVFSPADEATHVQIDVPVQALPSNKLSRNKDKILDLAHEIKNGLVKKGMTSASAISDVAAQAVNAYFRGESIDIAETAGKVVESVFLEEVEHSISTELKAIELVDNGLLTIKKGSETKIAFKVLPKRSSDITCEKRGTTLFLGARNGGGNMFRPVFNLTYAGELPNIKVSGNGVVHVMGDADCASHSLILNGNGKCVIESLRARENCTINLSDLSRIVINRYIAPSLQFKGSDGSEANILGLSLSGKLTVGLEGNKSDAHKFPSLRADGRADSLEAQLGIYAKFNGLGCVTQNCVVSLHPESFLTEVNTYGNLLVKPFGRVRKKLYSAQSATAEIEYAGSPKRIQITCDIPLSPSKNSSVVSWFTGKIAEKTGLNFDSSKITEHLKDKIAEKIAKKVDEL